MNIPTTNHRYYNWTITSGDYLRDYESTERFAKEQALKRTIEKLSKIIIYMGISISLLVYSISLLH